MPRGRFGFGLGIAKRRRGGFGPNLVTNGDGSSVAGWTANNVTLSLNAGYLRLTRANTTAFATASQTIGSLTVGRIYRITFDFLNPAVADIYVGAGSGTLHPAGTSGVGASFDWVCDNTVITFAVGWWNTAGALNDTVDFDNITMRMIL